jgi:hypothetical protein
MFVTIHYEIRVRGELDPSWSGWLHDFTITHDAYGDTVLKGEVVDNAAFYALLSRVRDLGLTVLSVQQR